MRSVSDPSGGERTIGPFAAGLLIAGNMIGSGVYLLPATLARYGSATVLGWMIAFAGTLCLSLVCAILITRNARDNGLLGAIDATLGRFASLQTGFVYLLVTLVGNAAIALTAGAYLLALAPRLAPVGPPGAALALIWLCVAAAMTGSNRITQISGATLVIGLLALGLAIAIGAFRFDRALFWANWSPSGRSGWAIATTSLPSIVWAFLGFESAAMAAAAVRDPARNVPIATLFGVTLAGIIYVLFCTIANGLAPADVLARAPAPLAVMIGGSQGATLAGLAVACAAVKATGTLAGWTFVGVTVAVDVERLGLFPAAGRSLHRRRIIYLLAGGVVMSLAIILSGSATVGAQFGRLIDATSVMTMFVYIICAIALLRGDAGANWLERTWARCAAVLGLIGCLGVVLSAGWALMVTAIGGLVVGAAISRLRLWTGGLKEASLG